jgi:hypothetical protein
MVVSFMIVIPFSLGFVVVRFDRTAAPIASVVAEPIAGHVQHLPPITIVSAAAVNSSVAIVWSTFPSLP